MIRCLFLAELFLILTQTIRLGLPLLAASGGDDAAFQEVKNFIIYLSFGDSLAFISLSVRQMTTFPTLMSYIRHAMAQSRAPALPEIQFRIGRSVVSRHHQCNNSQYNAPSALCTIVVKFESLSTLHR